MINGVEGNNNEEFYSLRPGFDFRLISERRIGSVRDANGLREKEKVLDEVWENTAKAEKILKANPQSLFYGFYRTSVLQYHNGAGYSTPEEFELVYTLFRTPVKDDEDLDLEIAYFESMMPQIDERLEIGISFWPVYIEEIGRVSRYEPESLRTEEETLQELMISFAAVAKLMRDNPDANLHGLMDASVYALDDFYNTLGEERRIYAIMSRGMDRYRRGKEIEKDVMPRLIDEEVIGDITWGELPVIRDEMGMLDFQRRYVEVIEEEMRVAGDISFCGLDIAGAKEVVRNSKGNLVDRQINQVYAFFCR